MNTLTAITDWDSEPVRLLIITGAEFTSLPAAPTVSEAWEVTVATSAPDAVGMYALYAPDLIVLDSMADYAPAVLAHLGTLATADQPDAMLILSDTPMQVNASHVLLRYLPPSSPSDALRMVLHALLTERERITYQAVPLRCA
jgi:CheY-like chemotaxis protein